jgi:protein O-mannosyl-transferase
MGLFYLLTLYGFIRGADSPRWAGWFTLSVVACFLGMASKKVMVTAPATVLLYDQTFVSGSFREAWKRHRRLYLGLAGTWLLLGYLMVGLHYRAVGFGMGISSWAYALTESRVVVRYLWLAFWPHPLVVDYGDSITIWHHTEAAPYILILAVLGAGVLLELRRQPSLGFIGAWFFIILAPASSVIPVVGQAMAEHRMYLPLAAVIAMVIIGGFTLGRNLFATREQTWQRLAWGVSATIALVLTILTIQRNRDYHSELSIWQDTVAKCPGSPRAHFNLAQLLSGLGRREEAITHYTESLRLDPTDAMAHYNLANLLAEVGREPEAIPHYSVAARLAPHDARSRINLGNLFLKEAHWDYAIAAYTEALRVNPNAFEAHNNLAIALANRGDLVHAVDHFREAARLNPNPPEVHSALAEVLARLGRHDEAQQELAEARRLTEIARPH